MEVNENIKKMPENDQRLLAYLKRTNYDKYIEFLSKYEFPKRQGMLCIKSIGSNE